MKAKPIYLLQTVELPLIQNSIDEFLKDWLAKHSIEDDTELFHYTTMKGLKGIIENRSLWFTNISSVNDPQEKSYGKEIILKQIDTELSGITDTTLSNFFHDIKNYFSFFYDNFYEMYIACFCKNNNLLSQWRAYSNIGGGYNIGFKFKDDTRFIHNKNFSSEDSHVLLRRVIYEPEKQSEIVSQYFALIKSGLSKLIELKLKDNNLATIISQAAMLASNILFDFGACFKNQNFSEENEWRLIKIRSSKAKPEELYFRDDRTSLIPYLNTYIYNNENMDFPISSIKIGPSIDSIRFSPIVNLFLQKESEKEDQIKIDHSSVLIEDSGYKLRGV